jgi:hypothetical protein
MMPSETELAWLIEHRPDPAPPSPAATDRARAALLAHGDRRRRTRRRAGAVALAAAAAVVVVVVAVVVGSGHASPDRPHSTVTSHRSPRQVVRPPSQTLVHTPRAPLATFASYVSRLPARHQRGDATLVVRYTVIDGHHEVDGAIYGGYDLYTDAGRYYYAPVSLAQLQQLYDRHQPSVDGGDEAKALRTIAAAAGGTPAQARAAVLRSLPPPATRAQIRHQLSTMPPRERRHWLHVLLGHHSPAEIRSAQDSHIYGAATQALEVGAGRPAVRAASINALSTLRHVRERRVRLDGVAALRIDYPDDGTRETIWLDARTGVPIQEQDGTSSATAFEVKRVNAAHLPRRVSPADRLR